MFKFTLGIIRSWHYQFIYMKTPNDNIKVLHSFPIVQLIMNLSKSLCLTIQYWIFKDEYHLAVLHNLSPWFGLNFHSAVHFIVWIWKIVSAELLKWYEIYCNLWSSFKY